MAVAYDASSESHTGTTGSVSEASFSWTHTPVGTPKGVLIYVMQDNASTDKTTSVTYGGTTVPAVTGGFAADTSGEIRACKTFFLGSGIGAGAQTVVVNRTNDTTVMYAIAVTVTAAANTEVYLPGIVLQQTDTALVEQNVDDGSNGVNSVRFAGGAFALNSAPADGANSNGVGNIDFGSSVAKVTRRNGAGQGSLPVGFANATVDDVAAVYLAVREANTLTIAVAPGALGLTTPGLGYSDIYGDSYGTEITVSYLAAVTSAALTLTGAAIAVTTKAAVTPGAMTLTGKLVALSISGGGTVTINVSPPGASIWDDLVVLWSDPVVAWDSAGTSLSLFGSSVVVTTKAPVTVGAITLAGAAITQSRRSAVTPGAVTQTGQTIAVFTEGGTVTLAPDPGAITFAGADAALSFTVPITAGAATLAGRAVAVSYRVRVLTFGEITFVGCTVAISGPFEPPEVPPVIVPNISHAGSGRIGSPELPGLQRERKRVGLTR